MELLVGLIGTLVGAFVIFVSELWKQVLDGKAAARLIYVESHQNALLCNWAADGQFYQSITDSVWQAHSVHITPLLTIEASSTTVAAYLGVSKAQQMIEEAATGETEAAAVVNDLNGYALEFRKAAYWMHVIETKGRLKLLFELLRGRPALPSEQQLEHAIATTEAQS